MKKQCQRHDYVHLDPLIDMSILPRALLLVGNAHFMTFLNGTITLIY